MNDEHLQLIEDCETRESRLTEREGVFIDDIGRQVRAGRALTNPQAKWLNDIWDRVTSNG